MPSLIPSVGPSCNTKKLCLRLLLWDNELLSTPKNTTFLANSLPKLHKPSQLKANPQLL